MSNLKQTKGASASDDPQATRVSSSSFIARHETTGSTRENARRRKIENENRRSMVWQSEGMQAPPAAAAAPAATAAPAARVEPPALPHPSHGPTDRSSGSLLDEKRSIAGRSVRRMSSRRSQLSTQSSSQRSMDSALGEKTSISQRSNQRFETRQAAWRIKLQEQEEEHNLCDEAAEEEYDLCDEPDAKPGTAEAILPTVTEMDHSVSTAPPSVSGTSWPDEKLVTAVVVDEEQPSDNFMSSEIAIATEVEKEEQPSACRKRLPALLCLALVCIIAINVGIVMMVLQAKTSEAPSSTTDSAVLSDWDAPSPSPTGDIQPRPSDSDQDDPTQPILGQTIAPTETPPPLSPSTQNNGRPTTSNLNNGRPTTAMPSTPSDSIPPVAPAPSPAPTRSATEAPTPVPTRAPSFEPTFTTQSLFLRSAPPTKSPTLPWVHFVAAGGDENDNSSTRPNGTGNNGNGNGNQNGNGNGNRNNNSQGNGNGNNSNGRRNWNGNNNNQGNGSRSNNRNNNWRGNGNGNNNNQGNGNGNNWRGSGNGNNQNQFSP